MRILMIGDRNDGGIKRHVDTICSEIRKYAEVIEINGETFRGHNGHDFRALAQFISVYLRVKPDVVHFHTSVFWFALCIFGIRIKRRIFRQRPLVVLRSWHTPTVAKEGWRRRLFRVMLGKNCYYLPVSKRTWDSLKWSTSVNLEGEVLYNPVPRITSLRNQYSNSLQSKGVIGLIGRFSDQKDWDSFVSVCNRIKMFNAYKSQCKLHLVGAPHKNIVCWGVGVSDEEAHISYGEDANAVEWKGFRANGRDWIRQMDVFVLTSKHEEMPTVVLEAFAERTAICGFIPEGGMEEILSYSVGPLREVFIKERNVDRLAEIALSLVLDEDRRLDIIEDGWRIFNSYFAADKVVRDKLMPVYNRLLCAAKMKEGQI